MRVEVTEFKTKVQTSSFHQILWRWWNVE